ncbi:hypothetical protein K443DRAFT_125983 [Laccaria amethystina LaAM-08-1]|uniref:Uncharacterized protein n=1 Tax=Laccaria amethystina LaAM-08-1 TaxID=1095629 RepID=A0A0C9WNW6_9AGAR|nr:hypothetical protein K443DRAFT_125983 [Laccaria amethystina LaAM-08-1]
MRSTLFYVIATLFATTQAVVIRSPGIAVDNKQCESTFKTCHWNWVMHRGSLSGMHHLLTDLFSFPFLMIENRVVQRSKSARTHFLALKEIVGAAIIYCACIVCFLCMDFSIGLGCISVIESIVLLLCYRSSPSVPISSSIIALTTIATFCQVPA